MNVGDATELILIRHAPALTAGRLCGRTDVAADCSDTAAIGNLRRMVRRPSNLVTSPALRCVQTAKSLWPGISPNKVDQALWEQNFGDWDGMPYAELPDIGARSPAELADHRPPNGESFSDVVRRVAPALTEIAKRGDAVIVAHAGTARAAIALATGSVPAALAFEIAPLSQTCLKSYPDGSWSVVFVNRMQE